MPNSDSFRRQGSKEDPVLSWSGVQRARRNAQGSHLIPSSPSPLFRKAHPNSWNSTLWRVLSLVGGATIRKGAGGGRGAGESQPKGHMEPREHFKALPAQRFHRSFDAVGLISLLEGPPGSRDWGLNLKARGTPGPLALASSPRQSLFIFKTLANPSSSEKPSVFTPSVVTFLIRPCLH